MDFSCIYDRAREILQREVSMLRLHNVACSLTISRLRDCTAHSRDCKLGIPTCSVTQSRDCANSRIAWTINAQCMHNTRIEVYMKI